MPVPSISTIKLIPSIAGKLALAGGTLALGSWLFSDLVHLPGGGAGFLVLGAGIWWVSRPSQPAQFSEPSSILGWIRRCELVLAQFTELELSLGLDGLRSPREEELDRLKAQHAPLSVGVVVSEGGTHPSTSELHSALESSHSFELCIAKPLPVVADAWSWPDELEPLDVILYGLPMPLRAADLLRLEELPTDRPAWLLIEDSVHDSREARQDALSCQLPKPWCDRLLFWSGDSSDLRQSLLPVRRHVAQPSRSREITKQRLLTSLHRRWQAELEQLRRERFRSLLQRSQWIVAGVVIASPVPSVDLLAVAVVNGLMVKEMAQIWGCSWSSEVLQVVARQLGTAALGQGVVEWSGQALLGLAKLDGGTWFAAGLIQGLSAAYLTRVVGASMADWMALNAGVAKPDLDELKRQAPLLVAKAAERERLNLPGFADQAREWLKTQKLAGA
jgi:uncharacterized protein (DUF697 family)